MTPSVYTEDLDAYLEALAAVLADAPEEAAAEAIAEVQARADRAAEGAEDPGAAVREMLASLGSPERVAAEALRQAPERRRRWEGSIAGIPGGLSLDPETLASRMWNPADPRLLMPRAFGLGWSVNFGAVAVRLGLVRPDDEEPVPFANVPDRLIALGLVPPALLVAVSAVAAWRYRDLPRVPTHWGLSGPDQFMPSPQAFAFVVGPVAVALASAVTLLFVRKRSRLARTLAVSGLVGFSVIASGLHLDALYWALNGRDAVYPWVPIVAGLGAMFAALVTYSKSGLRAEWRGGMEKGV